MVLRENGDIAILSQDNGIFSLLSPFFKELSTATFLTLGILQCILLVTLDFDPGPDVCLVLSIVAADNLTSQK